MSEIHIGPHTRGDAPAHGHGASHHTYDREINLKAIGKWMAALVVITVIVQIVVWWMIRGMERMDARKDPGTTPIEREMRQPLPPVPRLQVAPNFYRLNQEQNEGIDANGAEAVPEDTRSDLEDMQALRAAEDLVLSTPAWKDQTQGRLRVPIDIAMEVVASRDSQPSEDEEPTGSEAPEEMQQQATPPPVPEEQRR